MAEVVTLEFVAKQLERVLAEQAATRDDLRVLTTIVLRHETMISRLDETLRATLEQVRAMVAQHQRFDARLRRLEETAVP
jgi:septal ring factor EnvC (AmiA/AmiB activator)